jgi:Fic family protein
MDGNGRLARFLMNAMLVTGSYAWTIVPLARRDEYMTALDAASSEGEIGPFAKLIARLVREQTKKPLAAPAKPSRRADS